MPPLLGQLLLSLSMPFYRLLLTTAAVEPVCCICVACQELTTVCTKTTVDLLRMDGFTFNFLYSQLGVESLHFAYQAIEHQLIFWTSEGDPELGWACSHSKHYVDHHIFPLSRTNCPPTEAVILFDQHNYSTPS